MLDALVVDERVARDRRGDREREDDPAGVRTPLQPTDEEDAGPDEDDPDGLSCAERGPRRGGADEHEHRRRPARDRVHEAHVRSPVRGREENEVRELERRRGGDPGDGCRLDPPRQRCHGREEDDRERQRDGRGRADVAGTGEEHVPSRVQCRGAERQQEGARRHRYASSTIVTGPSFTSATCIVAPKTPRETWTPSSPRAAQKRS